jgi:hypothetical protein
VITVKGVWKFSMKNINNRTGEMACSYHESFCTVNSMLEFRQVV